MSKAGDLIKNVRDGETVNILRNDHKQFFGNIETKKENHLVLKEALTGCFYAINYDDIEDFTWEAESIHKPSTTRNDILDKAKSIINGERQGTYGTAEDSFAVISQLWTAYLGKDLSSADVANMMILMKVARNASGVYKDDNWIDICGYAALGGEIQAKYNDK